MHMLKIGTTIFGECKNFGFYAVDVGRVLVNSVDNTSNVARLAKIILDTVKEQSPLPESLKALEYVSSCVVQWTSATKLPARLEELASGKAVKRQFFGCVNLPKLTNRVLLAVSDFFNMVTSAVKWGLITQNIGKMATFGMTDAALKNVTWNIAVAAWGSDTVDTACALYEEGPSVQNWLAFLNDASKLGSLGLVGRSLGAFSFVVPVVNSLSPILSIAKSIAKEYDIRVPIQWYAPIQG